MKTAIILGGSGKNIARQAKIAVSFLKSSGFDVGDCELVIFDSAADAQILSYIGCSEITVYTSPTFEETLFSAAHAIARICGLQEEKSYDLMIFYDSIIGNELCTRAAFRLDGSCVLNVQRINLHGDCFTVSRGVYSHNLMAEIRLLKRPYLIAVQKDVCAPDEQTSADVRHIHAVPMNIASPDWLKDIKIMQTAQKDQYEEAEIIIVGGRGVGGKAGAESLQKLAGLLGGVLGGSRPTIMNGWLSQNQIIGMSGHIVNPRLCIVLGASGMMPLVKGVEKSKTLIAVNLDRDAMIFKVSDVGIQADLHVFVKALIQKLESSTCRETDR